MGKKYSRKIFKFEFKKSHLLVVLAMIILLSYARLSELTGPSHGNKAKTPQSSVINKGFQKSKKGIAKLDEARSLSNILVKQLGKPYVYGNEGPDSFDCSGLVQYAYSSIGVKLPRVASDQSACGIPVDKSDLEFGDILFFSSDGVSITHTGIYVGDGNFIHAPKTGDVVKISTLESGYYYDTYREAVRILD